jgi:serine/threonine protein kinase
VDEPPRLARPELTVGQLSKTYDFFGQIGSGGMGVIYKARHAMLKKDVAIKILHLVNEINVQRFQREAQAAYNLRHENVVAVHEFGMTEEGQPYMVMEFIEGKTLSTIIDERGALPLELCINIFKQVCAGIAHAHAKGVLHRDIKPSNVMLTNPESWSPQVRIVDFGIAKVLDADEPNSGKLTRTGDFLGSPLYMSPEQCLGKNMDLRSDIYSIGCIMYEALTGKPPLSGETPMETLLKQMNEKAPSLKEGSGGISYPTWVERLVARALAKDPDARFQTVEELKTAIEERVVPDSKIAKNNLDSSKNRFNVPVVAVSSVALLAVATAGFYFMTPHEPHQSQTSGQSGKMPSQLLAEQFPNLRSTGKKPDDYTDLTDPSVLTPPTHDEIIARFIEDRSQTTISGQHQTLHDSALAGLKDRMDVKVLMLSDCSLSDKALAHARHLPLINVDLDENKKVTEQVLSYINPDFLEELHLSKTGFSPGGIAKLADFPNLRTLDLSYDGITDASLVGLKKLPALIDLDLGHNRGITDAGLSVISSLAKLRHLSLGHTHIDGTRLQLLRNLKNLSILGLNSTRVDDVGIAAIQGLPLTNLNLRNAAITDGAVKYIATMKNLRELNLERVPLSASSLTLLATLPLNKLQLDTCSIDDKGLEALAQCKSLRELHLRGNPALTSKGLASLQKLPLQELDLAKTNISDSDLPVFYGWTSLHGLDLGQCPGVTRAGIEKLKTALGHDCSVFPLDTPDVGNINWGSQIMP